MTVASSTEIIDLTVGSTPIKDVSKDYSNNTAETLPSPTPTNAQPNEDDGAAENTNSKEPSRKRKRKKKKQLDSTQDVTDEPPPLGEEDGLFFVDLAPVALPQQPPLAESAVKENEEAHKLLLPAHVSVFGSTPVEILAPTTSLEEDSIQFLDYDDGKVFHRYWEEQEPAKVSRIICRHCGGEGHKGYDCPILICLTCGARDDHPTRSCPISKVCFNCGMKGHINASCPNRGGYGMKTSSRFIDCERCSSSIHKTNECPTWWRMYSYLSDEAQGRVLAYRQKKQDVPLGQGGEGYIADDQWCYMCGNVGHLGDDCDDYQQPDQQREPSAFSLYNIASGPFYDPKKDGASSSKAKRPRPVETFMDLERVPDDVGRRGRDKARSRLAKAVESRLEDDPDDWFNRSTKSTNKSAPSNSHSKKPAIQFSDSIRGDRRPNGYQNGNGKPEVKPSLLERMEPSQGAEGLRKSKKRKERDPDIDFVYDRGNDDWRGSRGAPPSSKGSDPQRHNRHSNNGYREDSRDKAHRRDRDKDRDRDRDRSYKDRRKGDEPPHRRRYRGGYT